MKINDVIKIAMVLAVAFFDFLIVFQADQAPAIKALGMIFGVAMVLVAGVMYMMARVENWAAEGKEKGKYNE